MDYLSILAVTKLVSGDGLPFHCLWCLQTLLHANNEVHFILIIVNEDNYKPFITAIAKM
jgi:hypothetical protein